MPSKPIESPGEMPGIDSAFAVLEAGPQGGAGARFGVVVSRFNTPVTEKLLHGALAAFTHHGVHPQQVTIVRVPGAFELPLMAQRLAQQGASAVVTLGAVIRGETPHFDFVSSEAARGCGAAALACDTPIVFGVLTTDTVEQALARAGGELGNKGWDAAETALELVATAGQLAAGAAADGRGTPRTAP